MDYYNYITKVRWLIVCLLRFGWSLDITFTNKTELVLKSNTCLNWNTACEFLMKLNYHYQVVQQSQALIFTWKAENIYLHKNMAIDFYKSSLSNCPNLKVIKVSFSKRIDRSIHTMDPFKDSFIQWNIIEY